MKFTDLLLTASSNMARSKVRSGLTIVAIFIGAFTLTLTNGIGAGVSSYIDQQLSTVGAEDMLFVSVKSDNPLESEPQPYDPSLVTSSSGFAPIPVLTKSDIDKIRKVPGVLDAQPLLTPSVEYAEGPNNEKFRLDLRAYVDGMNTGLAAGSPLDNASDELQLSLPTGFTKALGFDSDEASVGKTIIIGVKSADGQMNQVKAKVVNVQEKSLMGSVGAQTNKALTKALYDNFIRGLPEAQTNQYVLALARFDSAKPQEELDKLKSTLDEKGYSAQTVKDQIGIFKQVIDAIVLVLNFFAGIALLAASFGIVNTLFMAVQERTKEIGLMKAMGMRSRKVFTLFSIEAVLLGFWGSLLGSLAGIATGQLVNHYASSNFLKDLPGFTLMTFSIESVVIIMAIIMLIAFLAGTLPARRASKKDPIEALRYE